MEKHVTMQNARPDWPLAVVVGAGGMGMAVARRLGQTHQLLVADRDEAHLGHCIEALGQEGHDATALRCDVSCMDDVTALAAAAQARGNVRTLAHVVGLSVSAADFRAILSVNLMGATMVANAFRDILVPGGSAVFISSSAAYLRPADEALWPLLDDPLQPGMIAALEQAPQFENSAGEAYSLSKQGLNRMCRREARSWGSRGLRLVSLSPGLIATPMGAESYKHSPVKQKLLGAVPLSREGTMLEIANVVEFLTSDRASYISGTDILVDGGMVSSVA